MLDNWTILSLKQLDQKEPDGSTAGLVNGWLATWRPTVAIIQWGGYKDGSLDSQ